MTLMLVGKCLAGTDDSFTLNTTTDYTLRYERTFRSSDTCQPFSRVFEISGLSITGYIEKNSPEYAVKVIMTDIKGNDYLVLESYEELYSDSIIHFNNYCEETAYMDNVIPQQLKIYLRGATLHMTSLQTSDPIRLSSKELENKRRERRSNQVKDVINRINHYNQTNNRLWLAGETALSQKDYSTRMRVMGIAEDAPSGGLEYYFDGIFEFGHSFIKRTERNDITYADHFDWRDHQGKNWITPVKDQGNAGYCTAFGVTACVEAMASLHYNRLLNLDLSEKEIVCCADTAPLLPNASGMSIPVALRYVRDHGICDEIAYPYVVDSFPQCVSDTIHPTEQIKMNFENCYGDVRSSLITKGPLVTRVSNGIFQNGHCMLLVGYGTIHEGDSFYMMYDYYEQNYFSYNIYNFPPLQPNDERIGANYWIFKNSWGDNSFFNNAGGYIYVLDTHNLVHYCNALVPPVTSMNYTDDDIAIEDMDGDGYYNWGIGLKPARCPAWIPDDRDDDDTDPSKYYMGPTGTFPPMTTWPQTTEYITEDRVIDRNFFFVNDISIYHSATLTIEESAYCMENVKIIIDGGTLIVDGGVLGNANIQMGSSSTLIIRNGGSIYMKDSCNFVVPEGCTMNISEGNIYPHQKRL